MESPRKSLSSMDDADHPQQKGMLAAWRKIDEIEAYSHHGIMSSADGPTVTVATGRLHSGVRPAPAALAARPPPRSCKQLARKDGGSLRWKVSHPESAATSPWIWANQAYGSVGRPTAWESLILARLALSHQLEQPLLHDDPGAVERPCCHTGRCLEENHAGCPPPANPRPQNPIWMCLGSPRQGQRSAPC